MKIFDPKRHLPVGWEWDGLKARLGWYHGLSTISLFSFLSRYFDARAWLYDHKEGPDGRWVQVLIPGRIMPAFSELMEGLPLLGMWCFLILMGIQVWRYYSCHTRDSMAIYTMRRLPDKWELHRRCLTQPVLSAVFEVLLFAVLTVLCFALYYFATPAGHLPG